jgi:RES domain-containing protein
VPLQSSPAEGTRLYRVVAAQDCATAFNAQPPYKAGRWTSEGTPALYASLSAGAALLEKLVHLEDEASASLVLAIGCMPPGALTQVPLPPGWDALPHRESVQRAGDAWLQGHRHLGLIVPSAVIHAESNVILDVEHPDFVQVRFLESREIQIDRRLRQL